MVFENDRMNGQSFERRDTGHKLMEGLTDLLFERLVVVIQL